MQDACIGSIDDWASREYAWGVNFWTSMPFWQRWLGSDKSVVHVSLYRVADAQMYPPGRHLLRADQKPMIFDSNPELIFVAGKYDVQAMRMTDFYCGRNYTPEDPNAGTNL